VRRRLWQRHNRQLAIQDCDADAVLPKGGGSVAARREHFHEAYVGRLVERVDFDATFGRLPRPNQIAGVLASDAEPVKDRGDRAFDARRPRSAPVVEVGAVAKVEAGEKWAAG
jgi:hypothetical protein